MTAGAMLGQMILDVDRTDRGDVQSLNQIRQELVLTAGRHDAELGYQLLRSTQQQPAPASRRESRESKSCAPICFRSGQQPGAKSAGDHRRQRSEGRLSKDTESLDKGEFPTALNRVLSQLQQKILSYSKS